MSGVVAMLPATRQSAKPSRSSMSPKYIRLVICRRACSGVTPLALRPLVKGGGQAFRDGSVPVVEELDIQTVEANALAGGGFVPPAWQSTMTLRATPRVAILAAARITRGSCPSASTSVRPADLILAIQASSNDMATTLVFSVRCFSVLERWVIEVFTFNCFTISRYLFCPEHRTPNTRAHIRAEFSPRPGHPAGTVNSLTVSRAIIIPRWRHDDRLRRLSGC